jgi:hypothetical protein
MAQTTYSIKVTLESVEILDDQDFFAAGEIYVLASIDGHGTGRSPIFKAKTGQTITLSGAQWTHEVLLRGRTSIGITMEVWDEDLTYDDPLGALIVNATAPFAPGKISTTAPSGNYILHWSLARTIVTADRAGVGMVSRQHDGSTYKSTLASPKVAFVNIREIKGLYKPGVDDRPIPIAPGTTKNSSYVAGYLSEDNKGRIFRNRAIDGSWSRNNQQIDLTVEIRPAVSLPNGCKIKWTYEDPDDPTNESPTVHAEAGKILDPNDYSGAVKTAAAPGDNDPSGVHQSWPYFAQVDALYSLTSAETTVVDIPSRISKVRFNTSDVGGDNYRIKAELVDCPGFDLLVPDQTGIMTVWDRVDLEYVKMASALELPVNEIATHYDLACVQVDVSLKRVVTGASDIPWMSIDPELYATKKDGEFTMEKTPGWFFIVAANREGEPETAKLLYQGDAECRGSAVFLPSSASVPFAEPPRVIKVFDPAKVASLSGEWPNDRDMHFKFFLHSSTGGRQLDLAGHDFHTPDSPNKSFMDAHLSHYGFAIGSTVQVQVWSSGDTARVTTGYSPGGFDTGGKHYFGGRLIVYTRAMVPAEMIRTLCHELCHAFDNAHKCGNWDWRGGPRRTACCMNYWFHWVLDNATPRVAIPWTQNRVSSHLCAAHIRRMRDYHLEENPGLGW